MKNAKMIRMKECPCRKVLKKLMCRQSKMDLRPDMFWTLKLFCYCILSTGTFLGGGAWIMLGSVGMGMSPLAPQCSNWENRTQKIAREICLCHEKTLFERTWKYWGLDLYGDTGIWTLEDKCTYLCGGLLHSHQWEPIVVAVPDS